MIALTTFFLYIIVYTGTLKSNPYGSELNNSQNSYTNIL